MKRIAAVMAALAFACTAVAQARPITLDDFRSIVGVSDATISPDGTRIAYIVSRADFKADRNDRTLMVYDVRAQASRPLAVDRRGIGALAWSPDGTRLAFLALSGSGDDASEQVFVMDMRGGDAMRVTDADQDVQQFAWRPDGNAMAFVTADPQPKTIKDQLKRHVKAFVVGDQSYLEESAPTPSHLWLATPADPGQLWKTQRLTSGSWSVPPAAPPSSPSSPISWSPDGRQIAFGKSDNPVYGDSDHTVVAVLDVQTHAIRTLTNHGKLEGFGAFSPDGTKIAYWYPYQGDPAGENDVYVTPSSGGAGEDVTAQDVDTNVQRVIWMPDSKSLLVSGHKDTDAALWIKPLGGPARRIDLHGLQPVQPYWLDASVAQTGAIAMVASTPAHPNEVYYLPSSGAAPVQATHLNDGTASLELGRVEPLTWQFENFAEDGVLTLPPHYDASRTYPLVLVIHGGPNSASITSFSAFNQLLASHGYIVFNPNYRGSDNLGETYWHAIWNDAGSGPGRDVMAGIAAVERHAHVDTSRIAISGWSYGGYMTTWLEGHYHNWKTAVAGAPVTNWIDEYDLSDNSVTVRYQFRGSPWVANNIQAYREQSPESYAWDVTTPTLLLSDTKDPRVPITQAYQFFRTLRDRGTYTRFFAYPVAGHFPGDPVRSLDVYRRWSDWIVQYLK